MTRSQYHAITKSLELIKIKVDEAYRYIRSDERGVFARERRDAFYKEIKDLQTFIDGCITGSEPESK